jgi:protein-S-isoprenylcysteine O-methyltransferase Ste14
MNSKAQETIGYLINGLSIAVYIYLAFVLDVPDFLAPLRYFGWVLLVLGMGLVALSLAALVSNRGAGLMEGGIYGLVRHPMYLGAIVCFSSFFFFLPHWLILLLASVNIAVIYAFILQGDKQNLSKFGNAYRRYMERVPRINLLAGIVRRLRSG